MPKRQPKRGRPWLADGSCVRLRPERPNHVWAYDFVEDRTHDGRKFRLLVGVDEYSRECLAIVVARRLGSADVLAVPAALFVERGPPEHIRSDNGPELTAKTLRDWLNRLGVGTLFIAPGSPWEKRLLRGLHRQAARRTARPRGVLHAAGGGGPDRGVATPLQHGPAALRARLSAAGA